MTIKAILFDKDGTLFHFNETWGPWFYDVLSELSDGKHDLLVELANILKYDYKTKTIKHTFETNSDQKNHQFTFTVSDKVGNTNTTTLNFIR